MGKADERRNAVLDKLADYVLAEGLPASSLRPLAQAADTSDRMLLYYFKDKAELIAATLERVAARLTALLNEHATEEPLPYDELAPRLRELLFVEEMQPYMRVWLEVAALASRGDAFYQAVGARLGRGFLAWGAAQLKCKSPEKRDRDAARLLLMIEGTLLLKSVGLDDVCETAFR